MGKRCWSQAVLESGSWGHSVLQIPALVWCVQVIEIKSINKVKWKIYMHVRPVAWGYSKNNDSESWNSQSFWELKKKKNCGEWTQK